jgi:hypothetical protein
MRRANFEAETKWFQQKLCPTAFSRMLKTLRHLQQTAQSPEYVIETSKPLCILLQTVAKRKKKAVF